MFSPDSPLYAWGGANDALFFWINGFHTGWWDQLMLAATAAGNHANYALYLAAALLASTARPDRLPRPNVLVFALGYLVTGQIISFVKPLLDFPRPLLSFEQGAVHVLGRPEFHHSFPSGHATFAVLVAASLSPGTLLPVRAGLWTFAVLVCISRIAVGAHFPADVLGGALISLTTVLLVRWILNHVLAASLARAGRPDARMEP